MSHITSQPVAHAQLSHNPAGDQFADEGYGDGRTALPSMAKVRASSSLRISSISSHAGTLHQIKRKLTTKEGWLGAYDFSFLCMPQLPYSLGKGTKKTK